MTTFVLSISVLSPTVAAAPSPGMPCGEIIEQFAASPSALPEVLEGAANSATTAVPVSTPLLPIATDVAPDAAPLTEAAAVAVPAPPLSVPPAAPATEAALVPTGPPFLPPFLHLSPYRFLPSRRFRWFRFRPRFPLWHPRFQYPRFQYRRLQHRRRPYPRWPFRPRCLHHHRCRYKRSPARCRISRHRCPTNCRYRTTWCARAPPGSATSVLRGESGE